MSAGELYKTRAIDGPLGRLVNRPLVEIQFLAGDVGRAWVKSRRPELPARGYGRVNNAANRFCGYVEDERDVWLAALEVAAASPTEPLKDASRWSHAGRVAT